MKRILIAVLIAIPSFASAVTVTSESPICKSTDAINRFTQAKMFTDTKTMEGLIESGECTFVDPDIKATVIEKTTYPKVLVFVPYKSPITGWTTNDNLK